MSHTFSATIRKSGTNPYVEVPKEVSDALGIQGNIPVRGRLNIYPFRSTLVPIEGGCHRLYVHMLMVKGAKVGVGDTVTVTIDYDPVKRVRPHPDALKIAARENDLEEFDSLPRSPKNGILDT